MNGIHGTGRRLGLESLSTEGADVLFFFFFVNRVPQMVCTSNGVWPDQQQAGQYTQQRMDLVTILPTHFIPYGQIDFLLVLLHVCQNIPKFDLQWSFALWEEHSISSVKR